MKKAIFISILLISGLTLNAQCDKELSERVKSKMTDKEVLLNEFKIKLKKADIEDPAPVAKFSVKLEKGKLYAFRIESDTIEYKSNGLLKILDGNKLLGTNYLKKANKCYDQFHFKCTSNGDYKLLITFKDGKAGCAVAIVSYLGVFKSKQ